MNKRYDVLDGLRGAAAAVVVVLHHATTWTGVEWLVPHGYIAVDFFFALSGFVIAHAYETRLAEMGLGRFVVLRVIRLWPLVFVGALLGWIQLSISPDRSASGWAMLMAFGTAFLLLPWGHPRLHNGHIYPANTPFWSLGFELFANLAWALALPWITGRRLVALIAVCGATLLWLTRSTELGDLGTDYWWAGFPRVGFAYGLGLACYRWRHRFTLGAPFLPLAAALFALPWLVTSPWSAVLIVGLAMPAIVLAGANSASDGRIIRWLGDLSYPVYVIHYPLGLLVFDRGGPVWLFALLTLCLSWLALVAFDKPLRRRLTKWSAQPSARFTPLWSRR